MANITHEVWDFLNKNPAFEKSLQEDLINVRALADYIITKAKLSASTHAVISAIRRYNVKRVSGVTGKRIDEILKNSKISTKSRLISITISRDFSFLAKAMPDIFNSIDVMKGEVLRIAEGRESMKIFIDNIKKERIMSLLPKSRVLEVEENIGEINIHLDDSKGDAPGLVSTILNEFAANDINIIELIGCMPELIIFVKEKDISRTHDVILRFFYGD